MESYIIIDVYSSFLCNHFFQREGAIDNESTDNDFFTGYTDAEKYLSLDFDCPLKRLAVIPTGLKKGLLKNPDSTGKYSNKISS